MEKVNYSTKSSNPKENASLVSSLFFWWTHYVIKKSRKIQYEVEDLPSPLQIDLSHSLGNKLEKQWQREINLSKTRGTKPSLINALARTFYKEFIRILLLHAFNDLFISIAKQLLLGLFLIHVRDLNHENGLRNLTLTGILLVSFNGINSLLQNHFYSQSLHLACRIKVALTSLVYRKCLRLGNNAGGENSSAGMVVNLLSNDMAQFDDIIMWINYSWSGLGSTVIILVVFWRFIGVYPTAACLLPILLIMPIQIIISKSLARNRIRTAYASDKRIQIMDEIICGIQIIKMYAWEKPYEQLIQKLRSIEMKLIRKSLFLRGYQLSCSVIFSKYLLFALVVVYAYSGGDLLPEKIFTLVGFCTIISRVLCGLAFRSFGEVSQCYVSVKRIQHFLALEEFEHLKINKCNTEECAIHLSNINANWTIECSRNTISDLNFTAKSGTLTTVIGQIGAGKTSLLHVILGELPVSEGKVNICGSVSFYSQVPWIFAGTIRQNIIFSQDFERSRYNHVIEVCALSTDFTFLPDGDQTLVGERGITLSGGQKARIALARTIYQRADIYLLDDPLSAVDANVGKHIFEKCILDFLKNTTRVLITHQLQFLKNSNKIVVLHEGSIQIEGTFEELLSSKVNYLNTLRKIHGDNSIENKGAHVSQVIEDQSPNEANADKKNDKTELESEENEVSGSQALFRYILNGIGLIGLLTVGITFIVSEVPVDFCEIWITIWTHFTVSKKSNPHHSANWKMLPKGLTDTEFFILGFAVLIIGGTMLIIVRSCSFAFSLCKCAKKIHNIAFKGVVYTNSEFFHNNPSGRILNRFSKDLGIVDGPLPLFLLDTITAGLCILFSLIITSAINYVYFILAVIALISLFLLRQYYLGTLATFKRLENITKSPVFVHVHTTMQGLPIIRSNGAAEKLIEQFDQCQDTHTAAWYLYSFTGIGYNFSLEIVCLLYMIAVVTGCFFLNLSGSEIGLTLVQVTILLTFGQFAMKRSAEVSNQVNSIDRLLKYSSLPAERQPKEENFPNKNWPSDGKITFSNVGLCYTVSSAASIYDVSFNIEPMEKVGIVGRTGAGKSSLLAALFRLGHVHGSIKIDDVDTSNVRLDKLRSNIPVIPQDPILFSGTIRQNLDPFEEFDDAALWNALDQIPTWQP